MASNPGTVCGVCTRCYGFSDVSYMSLYDNRIDDPVKRGVISLKNGRDLFADIFGMGLSMVLEHENPEYHSHAVLVSVPTHPEDHPDRNYNPPDMLARRIAVHTSLPYRPDALVKIRPHTQKVHVSSEERFEEIQGSFKAPGRFKGERVVLVDDVMTTGATASECSRICVASGASSVLVLVAGRNFHFLEDREYE